MDECLYTQSHPPIALFWSECQNFRWSVRIKFDAPAQSKVSSQFVLGFADLAQHDLRQ